MIRSATIVEVLRTPLKRKRGLMHRFSRTSPRTRTQHMCQKTNSARSYRYIHRISTMLSQQLALNCVKVRVEATEGCSGLPGRDVECSAAHTFAHVLRCACAMFGVSPSQWRIYKDKNRWQELPLEATLEIRFPYRVMRACIWADDAHPCSARNLWVRVRL